MHDPNRKQTGGDPNVSDFQAPALWANADARRRTEDSAEETGDPATSDFGNPAWDTSNPGLTGDEPTNRGGTSEAGSGKPTASS